MNAFCVLFFNFQYNTEINSLFDKKSEIYGWFALVILSFNLNLSTTEYYFALILTIKLSQAE